MRTTGCGHWAGSGARATSEISLRHTWLAPPSRPAAITTSMACVSRRLRSAAGPHAKLRWRGLRRQGDGSCSPVRRAHQTFWPEASTNFSCRSLTAPPPCPFTTKSKFAGHCSGSVRRITA